MSREKQREINCCEHFLGLGPGCMDMKHDSVQIRNPYHSQREIWHKMITIYPGQIKIFHQPGFPFSANLGAPSLVRRRNRTSLWIRKRPGEPGELLSNCAARLGLGQSGDALRSDQRQTRLQSGYSNGHNWSNLWNSCPTVFRFLNSKIVPTRFSKARKKIPKSPATVKKSYSWPASHSEIWW